MSEVPIFPALNAALNSLAAVLLLIGFICVKQRRLEAHKKIMGLAFLVSAIFLASYLYYHFNFDARKLQSTGWYRSTYFAILIPHVILATLMVPFILRILFLAANKRFLEHAKMARFVWPVWMFVSVTGVLIYFMLYQWDHFQ